MTITTIPFVASVNTDDTSYSAKPGWVDMSGCRFHRGGLEIEGGYSPLVDQAVTGVPRRVEAWSDVDGNALMGIGTHTGLFVVNGGFVFNVTPVRDADVLATDPFQVFAGDTTALVAHVAHGLADGDQVLFSGATAVGGVTIGGGQVVATDPFTTIAGQSQVIVQRPAHGLTNGDVTSVSGGTAVGGITLSGIYSVSVADVDTFFINASSVPTSSATGGGSVTFDDFHRYTATVVSADIYSIVLASAPASSGNGGGSAVAYIYEIPVGNQDGGPSSGYGSGGYGTGPYGLSEPIDAFPLTWSLVPWGQDLLANPRNGRVYLWQPSTPDRAAVLSGAPTKVTSLFATPEKIAVAVGCEYLGDYDPMLVRNSDIDDYTTWAPDVTNAARFQRLKEGSRLVAGRAGAVESLIWSDTALYAMRYLSDPDLVYGYYLLGTQCGLIGPNAVAVKDGNAFWMAPNRQFYAYTGGTPTALECNVISASFGILADGQQDKVYAWFNSAFNEVIFGIPGASGEISNEIAYSIDSGSWAPNTRARTCAIDAPIWGGPVMLDVDGRIWSHESGYSANGADLTGYARTAPFDFGEGQTIADVLGLIPDVLFGGNTGALDFYLIGADYQASPASTDGPYTATPATQVFDTRASGRRMSLELRWSTQTFWRIKSQVRLNLQEAGQR